MKKLALAVMLVAGCAATGAPGPDPKVNDLERQSREIAARARQCVLAANKHSKDATGPNGAAQPSGLSAPSGKEQRDREISQCEAAQARENEELSSRERKEYQLQADQERDHTALMMILTTSRPH